MQSYKEDLTSKVKIDPDDVDRISTVIATEIRFLPRIDKDELIAATPVKLKDRLDELIAFQGFIDTVNSLILYSKLEFVRAQVVQKITFVLFIFRRPAFLCFVRICQLNQPRVSARNFSQRILYDLFEKRLQTQAGVFLQTSLA